MLQPIRHTAEATAPRVRPTDGAASVVPGSRPLTSPPSHQLPRVGSPADAPASHRPTGGVVSAQLPPKPCVLVVDDEPEVRLLARFALEERGYAVWEAECGRAALALFSTDATAPAPRIDAILLDVTMPGLDGIEVLGQLLPIRRVPVILSSGHPEPWARDRAPEGAEVSYLRKPYSFLELADHLDGLITTRV